MCDGVEFGESPEGRGGGGGGEGLSGIGTVLIEPTRKKILFKINNVYYVMFVYPFNDYQEILAGWDCCIHIHPQYLQDHHILEKKHGWVH